MQMATTLKAVDGCKLNEPSILSQIISKQTSVSM